MTTNISRTGLCHVETKSGKNGAIVLSASIGHPLSVCAEVEILEANSVRVERNGKGEIIRIFISGIIPKEGQ